VAYWHAR